MKKTITLALASALTAAAFNTQAQAIAVDGVLNATEISTTGYQLIGKYTRSHSFGDAGLLSFYAAADANNVYLFLAGTLETDGAAASMGQIRNALQIYLARPGVPTMPVGKALPMPALSNPITSFKLVSAKMDLPGDFAIGVKGNGIAGQVQVDGVVYTPGNTPTGVTKPINSTGVNVLTGAPVTITSTTATGAYALFANAVVAFKNSARLSVNPGASTQGGANSTGLEISLSRASLGLPEGGGALQVFGLQNNADGDFFSSDIIPQNTATAPGADPNGSLQHSPDFTAIPGRQAATLQVSATGVTLASKQADDQAVAVRLYPNPGAGQTTVAYQVAAAADASIVLTDLMGRTVRVLESGRKTAGAHLVHANTANIAAGTYLVRVQVGSAVSVRKLVLL